MRPFLYLSIAASLLLTSPRAFGQDGQASPVQNLLTKRLTTGAKAAGDNKAATHFKPAGQRLALDSYVNGLASDAQERKTLHDLFEKMLTDYEEATKSGGLNNDVTLAVAYAASQYWSLWKGEKASDKASDALYQQLRGALETPEMAKFPDAEKQRFYERTLLMVFTFQASYQAAKDDATKSKLATGARGALQSLLGADPDKLRLTEKGLEGIVASVPPPAARGSVAAGAVPTHTAPAGYEKKVAADGGVEYSSVVMDDRLKHTCIIRLLPPRPAPGGASKAFHQLWKETLNGFTTPDRVNAADNSTEFRRVFYPAKAVCHYMGGFFYMKDESVYKGQVYIAVYVFDLGKTIQPVVATVLPDTGPYGYFQVSALNALAKGFGPFVDSLKLPNVPPIPATLFTRADAVGDWAESESVVSTFSQYVTSSGSFAGIPMSAYGGAYRYSPDGTFNYRFTYANTTGTGNKYGQDVNEGTFTFKNDILYHNPKSPRNYKYDKKIVGCGFNQTDKGIKRTLVLRSPAGDGKYEEPPFLPNGKNWQGSVSWLSEAK